MSFNPYHILGVDPSCGLEEIRSAYRALARQYHPDLNHDPGAEGCFQEISLAYAILASPEKRALFDAHGEESLTVQFQAELARSEEAAREQQRGRQPLDITAQITIDVALAASGGKVRIASPVGGGALLVTIPAGVKDGACISLPGKGRAAGSGRPGDLHLEIAVRDPQAATGKNRR